MPNSTTSLFSFARQDGHNPWLDLLRTSAIFLVLLRHGSRFEGNGLSYEFLANIFRNGWVGVDLFFVLSGYLIAKGLIRRSGRSEGLFPKSYFQARILRIVPAYFAVLILCSSGVFPGLAPAETRDFIAHLLFLQDYTGSNINVVFWSLGVEEKFYILAPFVVMLLARQTKTTGIIAIAAALMLISPLSRGLTYEAWTGPISYDAFFAAMRSPFHMSLEGFVVGILVGVWRARGFAVPAPWAMTGFGAAAFTLVMWLGSHEFFAAITRMDAWLAPTFLAILFGLMVFCASCLPRHELPFEPFFRVNARLSYALYLVHFPLLPLAFALAQNGHHGWFWAAYLTLSYMAALALHFGIEKPFLLLKQSRNPPAEKMSSSQTRRAALS